MASSSCCCEVVARLLALPLISMEAEVFIRESYQSGRLSSNAARHSQKKRYDALHALSGCRRRFGLPAVIAVLRLWVLFRVSPRRTSRGSHGRPALSGDGRQPARRGDRRRGDAAQPVGHRGRAAVSARRASTACAASRSATLLHASVSDSVTQQYLAIGLYYNFFHETPHFSYRLAEGGAQKPRLRGRTDTTSCAAATRPASSSPSPSASASPWAAASSTATSR